MNVMLKVMMMMMMMTIIITIRSVGIHFTNNDSYFRFYRNFSVLLQLR